MTARILIVLAFLPLALAPADQPPELTEKFEQTYPLAEPGRVALSNVNGAVSITAWDRPEVKVEATKRARKAERLKEAEIIVEASQDAIVIRTQYPKDGRRKDPKDPDDQPATVEYRITVPRSAALDKIKAVNGKLELEGVAGKVEASTVNGTLTAKALTGEVTLATINGELTAEGLRSAASLRTVNGAMKAAFDEISKAKQVRLKTTNGQIVLRIPREASARLSAKTLHGSISNEFDLPMKKRGKGAVGRKLEATLGTGDTQIELSTLNGAIAIRHGAEEAVAK